MGTYLEAAQELAKQTWNFAGSHEYGLRVEKMYEGKMCFQVISLSVTGAVKSLSRISWH